MNKVRRAQIKAIIEALEVEKSNLEDVTEAEREAFDNLPESIQYSGRGEDMEEGIDELDEILEALGDAIDSLTDLIGG